MRFHLRSRLIFISLPEIPLVKQRGKESPIFFSQLSLFLFFPVFSLCAYVHSVAPKQRGGNSLFAAPPLLLGQESNLSGVSDFGRFPFILSGLGGLEVIADTVAGADVASLSPAAAGGYFHCQVC